MIYAVHIGLRESEATRIAHTTFMHACWALDIEPEYVDATENDSRADGVDVVPTVRVYADDDPYGDELAEHRGAFTAEQIAALLKRGLALA